MRLVVAAIGRLKEGPERELAERYRKRAEQTGRRIGIRGVEIKEIKESRAQDAGIRMIEESIALGKSVPEKAVIVALDEHGENLSSAAFAERLRRWRDEGRQDVVFAVGGDDGLHAEWRKKATLTWGLGAVTWPHQLARVMLLEQIYRSICILSGHPYHRA
jgi:23S rRNA (pseudouridine1915-N3)-methyltransferase